MCLSLTKTAANNTCASSRVFLHVPSTQAGNVMRCSDSLLTHLTCSVVLVAAVVSDQCAVISLPSNLIDVT